MKSCISSLYLPTKSVFLKLFKMKFWRTFILPHTIILNSVVQKQIPLHVVIVFAVLFCFPPWSMLPNCASYLVMLLSVFVRYLFVFSPDLITLSNKIVKPYKLFFLESIITGFCHTLFYSNSIQYQYHNCQFLFFSMSL